MVVFDIVLSPSLRRHDDDPYNNHNHATIDVSTSRTSPSSSSGDTTTVTNEGQTSSSSSSPNRSPTVANHQHNTKSPNASVTSSSSSIETTSVDSNTASTTPTASSSSSLTSLTDDDTNMEVEGQQQRQQLQLQRSKRRVTFAANNNLATIIDDNPVLFTDREKSLCFCSRKERALFEQDRLSVYTTYDTHMKYNIAWVETEHITLRGLEDFFGMRCKEEIRHEHVKKVLKEQNRQRQQLQAPSPGTGQQQPQLSPRSPRQVESDADTLRYVSSESSAEGRQRATTVGKDDAIVAARVHYGKGSPRNKASNNNTTNDDNKTGISQTSCLAAWEQQWF